jgi:hypothetical protein
VAFLALTLLAEPYLRRACLSHDRRRTLDFNFLHALSDLASFSTLTCATVLLVLVIGVLDTTGVAFPGPLNESEPGVGSLGATAGL